MKTTNYAKGRQGEYDVKQMLEAELPDYQFFRTAGSHTQADLIGLPLKPVAFVPHEDHPVILIQVKRGKKPSVRTRSEFEAWGVRGEKRLYWRPDGKGSKWVDLLNV